MLLDVPLWPDLLDLRARTRLDEFDLTTLGFPQVHARTTPRSRCSRHSHPTATRTSGRKAGWIMDRQEGVHHFSGSVTKFAGGHNIKFGGEYRYNFLDYNQPGYPSGQFTFARGITCRTASPAAATRATAWPPCCSAGATGNRVPHRAEGLIRGRRTGASSSRTTGRSPRKLTLNLGVRYDFDVPRWETAEPPQLLGSGRAIRRSTCRA